jgi:hypothetical protein
VPIQKCPLCLNIKPVVKSHLIPQALYDYCRPSGGNPIAISSNLVIESSRQHPARPILLFDFSRDIRAIIGQAMTTAHKARNVQKRLRKSK